MPNEKTLKGYLQNCKKYKKYNYKELEEKELDYLHATDLLILKEIQIALKKHNIPYCAVGGTLLGAYTRNTFIPWDEDIDIAVFEEDYERMIKVLMDELPKWMIVQCNYTEPKYYHEWIKVSDLYSKVFPNNGVYEHQGVWVDIYKLRKMKEKDVFLNVAKDHKRYLERRLSVGNIDVVEFNRRMRESNINYRIFKGKLISLFSLKNNYVYLIGTASKPYVREEFVFPLTEYAFVDTSITSFNNAEGYLKNHYGENFRELPPPEDRNIAINKVEIYEHNEKI